MSGTGRRSASQAAAWCMVVDPRQITSAPSSSTQRMHTSSILGKALSCLPSSRASKSGGMSKERTEAQCCARPYSAIAFL
ncbi:MAG: hypothetical protein A3G81_26545 [Betaproteobacteria bacterium RIFCSPLOWO2_12_FULL_65_14]|nr:MAG: hypothetical protein A3G81_26545 [Betaproteobacteria bacterium RIFCSPLOWO2_12_FULL_65_14]